MVSDKDDGEERREIDVIVEQKEHVVEEEENENTAIMTPSGKDDDAAAPSRRAQSFENDETQPVLNQSKAWFLRLTPQERSSATYCVDQAFIAAFLAMAPSLSTLVPTQTTEEADQTTPWGERVVSLTMFKEKYMAVQSSHQRTPKLTNRKSATEAPDFPVETHVETHVMPTSTETKDNSTMDQPEDDTFRIQEPVVTTELETAESSSVATELLQSTAIVHPSVFDTLGSPIEQKHPVMIVQPSFFEGSADVSDVFQFSEESDEEESPWLQHIAAYCGDDVRLGEVVRARFSHAIQQSFQEARGVTGANSDTLVAAGAPPLHYTLSKVFRRYDEVQSLYSTMSDEAKTKSLSNFLTDLSLEPRDCGVEVAIQTPLPLLLRANAKESDLNLIHINDHVQVALSRLKEVAAAVAAPVAIEEKLDLALPSRDVPKESKKKKKKNKKRKGKKSSVSQKPFPEARSTPLSKREPPAKLLSGPEDAAFYTKAEKPKRKLVESVPAISTSPTVVSAELLESSSVDSSDISIDLERMGPNANMAKKQPSPVSLSRFEGRGVVAPSSVASSAPDQTKIMAEQETDGDNNQDDNDDWATVEVKRTIRKKSSTPRQVHGNSHADSHSTVKKIRGIRNGTPSTRQKKSNRKIVKEVLHSIVERISEDQSLKFKPVIVQSPPRLVNSWQNGPPGAKLSQKESPASMSFAAALSRAKPEAPASIRDILVGTKTVTRSPSSQTPQSLNTNDSKQATPIKDSKGANLHKKPTPAKRNKTATSTADQNTAPTYQETVSAMSTASAVPNESKASPTFGAIDRKSDSSTGYTEEVPQTLERETAEKELTLEATPPLPTLLSPENASSATSSVGSSLEMPHTRHVHHHRSVSATDVNDVGYHLLDVCDRLSRDTSLFMSRRALALNIRRRERGALLAALQDSVSDLWPNQCHVQLYGSCATQLDLPASDIDVVVAGFEVQDAAESPQAQDPPHLCHSKSASSESIGVTQSSEDLSVDEAQVNSQIPSQLNADRVMRLAADLESKPWAVQVRAIPRASVPVIKILADPSRLGQSSGSGEWMSRHQHLAAQAAAASGQTPLAPPGPQEAEEEGSEPESYRQSSLLPWRGSDVMKGLLSLDITFEGIEHGGVGSTEFSAAVVSQFASEYGLHPDATPFVQVLMVLKELLAQRKLNEPYSGGLSSYALLLLLLALVREREVIRAEIGRFEQQKVAMTSDKLNTPNGDVVTSSSKSTEAKGKNAWKNPNTPEFHLPKAKGSTGDSSRNPSPSSWASIAKKIDQPGKSSKTPNQNDPQPTNQSSRLSFAQAAKLPQPPASPQTNPQQEHSLENKTQDNCGTGEPSSMTPPCFPQGYNDIVEVLCTGETTAGKLLMHFLLYYGQHFDAQSAAIDLRFDYPNHPTPYSYFSPYIQRRTAGSIDPVTGMLTVDPIVVYDPLYRYDRNVARRCFAWSQVRWIFAQSYLTLASAVERSKTPPSTPTASPSPTLPGVRDFSSPNLYSPDDSLDSNDPSSSLLRCLLSF